MSANFNVGALASTTNNAANNTGANNSSFLPKIFTDFFGSSNTNKKANAVTKGQNNMNVEPVSQVNNAVVPNTPNNANKAMVVNSNVNAMVGGRKRKGSRKVSRKGSRKTSRKVSRKGSRKVSRKGSRKNSRKNGRK